MQDIVFFISEHLILSGIWLICLIIGIFLTINSIFFNSKVINNAQAIKLINQEHAIIIDTRPEECFKKGHIFNSINIPLKIIMSGKIKEIDACKSSPIILILNQKYGYNKYIKEFLRNGFNRLYILKNGIYYWNLDHLPLVIKDK